MELGDTRNHDTCSCLQGKGSNSQWHWWALGLVFLLARHGWDYVQPMTIESFKGLFYLRDALTSFPASICWFTAICKGQYRKGNSQGLLRHLKWTRRLCERRSVAVVLLAVAQVLACLAVSVLIFRTRAHITDEANYLFQANVFASGRLWVPPPPASPEFFYIPYNVITPEKWYGLFFPGQSLLLSLGVLIRAPFLINPLLTGGLLLLTVGIGNRLFGRPTGLLAGLLMLLSPFCLQQGASYFSHITSALLFLPFILCVLQCRGAGIGGMAVAGICAGFLLLFRPQSAVVALLFLPALFIWEVLTRGLSFKEGLIKSLWYLMGALPGIVLFLWYNWQLTGDPLTTPYQVAYPSASPYKRGIGLHCIEHLFVNSTGLSVDMFGVPIISLVPLAVGIFFGDKHQSKKIVALAVVYMGAYSIGPYHSLSYGPRHYFELLPLFLLVSACGLRALPDMIGRKLRIERPQAKRVLLALCAATVAICLLGYLPPRLHIYRLRGDYYDIRAVTADVRTPALVFIEDKPRRRIYPYMAGFQLNDVLLRGPVIFARDLGARNQSLLSAFPGRNAYKLTVSPLKLTPFHVIAPARNERTRRHAAGNTDKGKMDEAKLPHDGAHPSPSHSPHAE